MPALGAILATATARVQAAGADEARLKCEWLVSRIAGCSRLELPGRPNQSLTESQVRQIEAGAARLAAGEPLQYVLGAAEFMGRVFACDRRALIPRPETEQLTDWILRDALLRQTRPPAVADVGAGSGCIVISLALERPEGRYMATDNSAAALALARENAARHGVAASIRFIACDLLPVTPSTAPMAGLDAVVSNPPYVRTDDWARLDRSVRDFEPREALDGGPDGLAVIGRLITRAWQALKPGGALFLEIGADQAAAVLELARAAGFRNTQVRPDLAGKDRMARAEK